MKPRTMRSKIFSEISKVSFNVNLIDMERSMRIWFPAWSVLNRSKLMS